MTKKTTIEHLDFGFTARHQQLNVWECFHQHDEIEVMLTKNGAITYRHNGNLINIHPGKLVVFWANIPHQIIRIEEAPEAEWVTIPFSLFLQWQLPDDFRKEIIQGNMLITASQNPAFDEVIFKRWQNDIYDKDHNSKEVVALEARAFLLRFARQRSIENNTVKIDKLFNLDMGSQKTVEKIHLFLAENYTENLSIENIAEEVDRHPKYVVQLFRKHCGIGLVEFITRLRISHAQRLLITGNKKITAIAFTAGFGSLSRFYKVFKQYCKISPAEYRKKYISLK